MHIQWGEKFSGTRQKFYSIQIIVVKYLPEIFLCVFQKCLAASEVPTHMEVIFC